MLNLFSLFFFFLFILFYFILFIYFFKDFQFSLPLLGQTSVQFAFEAAFSLESEGSEGACCSPFLCFLSFPPFLYFSLAFSFYGEAPSVLTFF